MLLPLPLLHSSSDFNLDTLLQSHSYLTHFPLTLQNGQPLLSLRFLGQTYLLVHSFFPPGSHVAVVQCFVTLSAFLKLSSFPAHFTPYVHTYTDVHPSHTPFIRHHFILLFTPPSHGLLYSGNPNRTPRCKTTFNAHQGHFIEFQSIRFFFPLTTRLISDDNLSCFLILHISYMP